MERMLGGHWWILNNIIVGNAAVSLLGVHETYMDTCYSHGWKEMDMIDGAMSLGGSSL